MGIPFLFTCITHNALISYPVNPGRQVDRLTDGQVGKI